MAFIQNQNQILLQIIQNQNQMQIKPRLFDKRPLIFASGFAEKGHEIYKSQQSIEKPSHQIENKAITDTTRMRLVTYEWRTKVSL